MDPPTPLSPLPASLPQVAAPPADYNHQLVEAIDHFLVKTGENAPIHVGDRPPEQQQYGLYYIPEVSSLLAEQVLERHKPQGRAKERLETILKLLTRPPSSLVVHYTPNLTREEIDRENFRYPFSLEKTDPWEIFSLLASLETGDVIACATYDSMFYVTPRPDLNIYKVDPLKRAKHAALEAEKDIKFFEQVANKARKENFNLRLMRVEKSMASLVRVLEATTKLETAVQAALRMHAVKNFNADLMSHMRCNLAELSKQQREMREQLNKLLDDVNVKVRSEEKKNT